VITSILVIVLGTMLTNCTKDPDYTNLEVPKLKDGTICRFFQTSYVTKGSDSRGYDSIFKVKDGLYRYKIVNEDYLIDTILFYRETRNVYISKQKVNPDYYSPQDTERYNWVKLFEMDFKNVRIVTEDSIVGQYYNSHYYNSMERKAVPDSGIFAIKILQ
jgi:hypothetical protein